jgi:hypothetical protein
VVYNQTCMSIVSCCLPRCICAYLDIIVIWGIYMLILKCRNIYLCVQY